MSEDDAFRAEESPSQPMTVQQVLDVLRCGEVVEEVGVMRWSSNYTFLLSIAHEGAQTMAVYKPQRGERPLWDFPDGSLCYREQAAFLTSQVLGWDLIPPTVLREGPHGLGSVQFYIDHDPEVNYFTLDESMRSQLSRLAVFDVIVNNADRKGGHCLVDPQGHLWAIDHGITFHSAPKLRTVIWDFAGEAIPDTYLSDLDRLYAILEDETSSFRLALAELLSGHEIRTLKARIANLLKTRCYPLPGTGPNYPWPPV